MADCSGKMFTTIPTKISSEIEVLIMDNNFIKKLDKDAFKSVGLTNLKKISLKKCGIVDLDENSFRDLGNLRNIDLADNNISKLKQNTFNGK